MNYIINTTMLFYALNAGRKKSKLSEIDNALISSKLGILFALRTNGYINFKGEQIELDESQLVVLKDIFIQHFNVDMDKEVRMLAVKQEQATVNIQNTSQKKKGFLNKVRGFLKPGPKVQGELV
ncbi:hypothetical protein QUF74_18795 [Candidatus Halobeggiatoa sp. HSG11]|nr:hypothetical protein [Candidatus Halobeggiatoa sp. HSG11]